jgi:pimeloyl-ACP methyl ester carboxylesterase
MGKPAIPRKALMIPDNPQIRMIWVPDAGHYLPLEKPKEVAEICRATAGELGLQ